MMLDRASQGGAILVKEWHASLMRGCESKRKGAQNIHWASFFSIASMDIIRFPVPSCP